jgi:hypothetical protein
MTEDKLLEAIGEIDEAMAMGAEEEKKGFRISGKKLLAVALAAVLTLSAAVTAFAASNQEINDLLYSVWPWAAQALKPVNLSCEDQGIRMEVKSASLKDNEAFVTLTMQDLTGDRLDETMDLFDTAALQLPCDGSGTCTLLDYDESTKTASFAVYMRFNGEIQETDKVSFTVDRFLTKKQETMVDLRPLLGDIPVTDSVPIPGRVRGASAGDFTDENVSGIKKIEVLSPQNSLEIPVTEGVTLCGAGIVEDILHVQIRYADIQHTDNHGFLWLLDSDGKDYGHGGMPDSGIFSVSWWDQDNGMKGSSDSWEEYLFADYPEDLSQIRLYGDFFTAAPAIEGNWRVTFPLSAIQGEEE